MASLILELQTMVTDSGNGVLDLLRKALLVASKLEIEDFAKWARSELHGYNVSDSVPKYRFIRTELKVWNPYNGLMPFYVSPEIENDLCDIHLRAPISHVVAAIKKKDWYPSIPFSPEQRNALMDIQDWPQMEPVRRVSVTCMIAIEDAVRSTILDWTLQLEKQGILGADLTQVHIENFQGVLGNVSGNVIQKNKIKVKKNDLPSLKEFLSSSGIEDSDIEMLEQAIQADGNPTTKGEYGEKVQSWIGKMISKTASGAWIISTAIAGELITKALGAYYGW